MYVVVLHEIYFKTCTGLFDKDGNSRWFKVIVYERGKNFKIKVKLKYLLDNVLVGERMGRKVKYRDRKGMQEDFCDAAGERLLDLLFGDARFPPYLVLADNGRKRHTRGTYCVCHS